MVLVVVSPGSEDGKDADWDFFLFSLEQIVRTNQSFARKYRNSQLIVPLSSPELIPLWGDLATRLVKQLNGVEKETVSRGRLYSHTLIELSSIKTGPLPVRARLRTSQSSSCCVILRLVSNSFLRMLARAAALPNAEGVMSVFWCRAFVVFGRGSSSAALFQCGSSCRCQWTGRALLRDRSYVLKSTPPVGDSAAASAALPSLFS